MTESTTGIRKSDELFRVALEQMPEGVTIVNADDRVVFVNRVAEEERKINAASQLAYLKNEEKKTFRRTIFDQERERYYEDTYRRLFDSSNTYIGSVVISRDVSYIKKLEEERATYLQDLEGKVDELTGELQLLFISSMSSLVYALEAKDHYTKGHSLRVSDLAVKMAEHAWGICQESREIELAGKLHDIGKIGIPELILNKPERLTEGEFDSVKAHPIIGQNILISIENLKNVAKLIRHHHERFDGGGYPDRLEGESIPDGAKILAIVDTYDAMTTARPYRPPAEPQKAAYEIERHAGTQFDPQWVKVFLELFRLDSMAEAPSVESPAPVVPSVVVPNCYSLSAC